MHFKRLTPSECNYTRSRRERLSRLIVKPCERDNLRAKNSERENEQCDAGKCTVVFARGTRPPYRDSSGILGGLVRSLLFYRTPKLKTEF